MSIHLPKLQSIIQDLYGKPVEVYPENRIVDLGLDSLDREEFSMVIEEEFDLKINSSDLRRLSTEETTIRDWVEYLEEKV